MRLRRCNEMRLLQQTIKVKAGDWAFWQMLERKEAWHRKRKHKRVLEILGQIRETAERYAKRGVPLSVKTSCGTSTMASGMIRVCSSQAVEGDGSNAKGRWSGIGIRRRTRDARFAVVKSCSHRDCRMTG